MTSKVLQLEDVIEPDRLATRISEKWCDWDQYRMRKRQDWEEVRRYVFATDTTQTSNSQLPWKNKTTIPKLCQIADNLYANYTLTLFPKRKWLSWEANAKDASEPAKRDAIENYVTWLIDQPDFKHEMDKVILDYIHFGNCFVTVEWSDQRVEVEGQETKQGYVGPSLRRISPLDIVMNPTAENFVESPKIVRSLVSLGELKEILQRLSNDENRAEYEALWKYLKETRANAQAFQGEFVERDHLYQIDGFSSFRDYLCGDVVELLTFYGDMYDPNDDTFLKNHVITVVDRHKLIGKKPNPSFFGYPPIFHCTWRKKQDNLWGMGPLDNLVGMQYRLDHVENMKADVFDLVTYPVQKVKGFVEDYTWQPGAKIFVSEEGDVDMLVPDVQALQANFEIQNLERMMEEMAGAPKEAMGLRTPGEKTKYEVSRLENAASRIYQNKCYQFSDQILEPALNAMLELGRRNMTGAVVIKVFDDEFKASSFQELTVNDITGMGRIRPVAARHFAEQAELIQNLTSLTQSQLWATVAPHFSSIKLAEVVEDVLGLEQYEIMMPFIAISEQAEAQKHAQAVEEQTQMETMTASGIGDDYDLPPEEQMAGMEQMMMQGQPE